jgi:hypothetical protein
MVLQNNSDTMGGQETQATVDLENIDYKLIERMAKCRLHGKVQKNQLLKRICKIISDQELTPALHHA